MNFSDEFLEEIKNRLSVSSVVSRRVKLQKRGREFIGLSPFSNEKSPSFTVNDEKGFYHCFSTNEHGNIFTFLMKTQNLSFPEAVERLAEEAGLELPRSDPRDVEQASRATKLREAVEAACMFFQVALQKTENKKALDYLHERGLGNEIIQSYRLGYAPPRNALKADLIRRGFAEDILIESRLLSEGKDGRESFDFFRDRVIFPIMDARGRPVAFGGRIMGEGEPKYLNSPETPLFHKGGLLYGLSLARPSINDKDQVIVCEGYMDVIALAQAGFPNAVAPLGTALTETQLELLWKLTAEPVMCFDGDKAGQRAAARAAGLALPRLLPGKSLQFALLPSGQDPDDLVRRAGPEAMTKVLSTLEPLAEIVWRKLRAENTIDTPEHRAGFKAAIDKELNQIADPLVREQYREMFNDRVWDLFRPGWRESRQRKQAAAQLYAKKYERNLQPLPVKSLRHQILILCLVNHPKLFDMAEEKLGAIKFDDEQLEHLRQYTLVLIGHDPEISCTILRESLAQKKFSNLLSKLDSEISQVHAFFADSKASPFDAIEGWEHTFRLLVDEERELDRQKLAKELAETGSEIALSRMLALHSEPRAIDDIGSDKFRNRDN